jgi:hypothetical protein
MTLAGAPARYNNVFVIIRQYGPNFATAHGGIQRHPVRWWLPDMYLFDFIYN